MGLAVKATKSEPFQAIVQIQHALLRLWREIFKRPIASIFMLSLTNFVDNFHFG
jgi:hypothetical protein